MNIPERKCLMRRMIMDTRKRLPEEYCVKADQDICRHILSSEEYKKADVIFTYVSKEGEADTLPVIRAAFEEGKRICVPRCIEKGQMQAFQIRSFSELRKGKYGILEPADRCPFVAKEEISLALIPCLSCDSYGNRLGYGGGYYDRYLRNGMFTKAVLCRSRLMMPEIAVESTDCRVDLIVTENGISYPDQIH